jgi:uncharacterized membrane protein
MKSVIPWLAVLMVLATSPAVGQNLSIGGAVGTNLAASFQSFPTIPGVSYSNTPSVICGMTAEWSSAGPFAIEADGLYRQMHAVADPLSASFSVVTWEFPILAKYRFSVPHLEPFLEAGPSFRVTGNLNGIHPAHYGFTAGVGVTRQVGRLRIEPALRFTHWAQDLESTQTDVRTQADQLELVVAVRPPSLSNTHPFGMRVSLGAVLGASLTSDFRSVSSAAYPQALANAGYQLQTANATFITSSGPRSFVGGLAVSVALPRHFSFLVEGIDRPLRSSVVILFPNSDRFNYADHRATWEFPMLGQYRWRIGRAKPFVEMGPSFRLLQDVYGAAPYGVAAGAGLETAVGRLKVTPGVRFTRWAQQSPALPTDPRRGEVALLTGFSF